MLLNPDFEGILTLEQKKGAPKLARKRAWKTTVLQGPFLPLYRLVTRGKHRSQFRKSEAKKLLLNGNDK